ncbi:MAG: AAA family ATPase [Lachnospiraceae bacterium]|nr:AAA family ATPase [Lachnospiraceae bacterium]
MVVLNRIYIENYKLFSYKEIDFRDALLLVFDGPNGYGKTSIFDAIELLVTGEISRVRESEAIDGKLAYGTVFFAKNIKRNVIIKGEFADKKKGTTLVIGASVNVKDLSGKQLNPKNIFSNIDYYILPSYDISIENWKEYLIDQESIYSIRTSFFGRLNLEKFTLFHYIRQEDRLAYFRQNEKARSSTIESLLGVENERNRYKKVKATHKIIVDKLKDIDGQLTKLKNRLGKKPEQLEEKVEYVQLLDGKLPWDLENIIFDNTNSEQLLAQFNRELDEIESYVTNKSLHKVFFALEKYKSVPEELRRDTISAWILLKDFSVDYDAIERSKDELIYLTKQKQLIDSQEYTKVDFINMCEKLKLSAYGQDLTTEVVLLKEISASQSEIQKIINSMLLIRENLHKEHQTLEEDTKCPYCGHDWEEVYKLEEGYIAAQDVFKSLLQRDGEKYSAQLNLIKRKVEEKCVLSLNEKIYKLSNEPILSIYGKFADKSKFINAIANCTDVLEEVYHKIPEIEVDSKNTEELVDIVITLIANLSELLTEDYLKENEKFIFANVKSKYNLNEMDLDNNSLKTIETKKKYIISQFYESFDSLQKESIALEEQKSVLTEIKNQLKEYFDAIEQSIDAYKKQIIDEIEIPFFVYSSRLLQSYQGGQGVLMENDGETIRFNAPSSEHDILYTMSSGQLSAVLLSFSLAMNKIYAGEGIKTMFIDDPIQCMDDINMISFVELLRREFGDCQIVLSTHEEDFSNFIQYKFGKYGLKAKAITLKEA